MNITHIEHSLKNLLGKSDQNFSTSKMHMFCRKNVCDLDNIRIRSLLTDSHHHAGFSNTNKIQDYSIEMNISDVLTKREKYSEKILAELYVPDNTSKVLLHGAYQNLDLAIEQCYRLKPFDSDEEFLEHVFTLYERMTRQENNK